MNDKRAQQHREANARHREKLLGEVINGWRHSRCLNCPAEFDQQHIEGKRPHNFCEKCREEMRLKKAGKTYTSTNRNAVAITRKLWYCLSSEELAPGQYYLGDVLAQLQGISGRFRDASGLIIQAINGRFEEAMR